MAVSALLICTSCVTKKKYLEAENGRLEAIGRGNALQEQLVDCKDAGDKLNERLAALQRDTAKMGSNIRNYQTMLNSNMTQQEKLNSLLSQKMEELNERERTINELQDMINAQNEKVQKLLSSVKDGDIILMHDLYGTSADAAVVLIPELKKRGYQLVTVSEMASLRGGMTPGQVYHSFRP